LILKIAAHCNDLNIVFDFERASVDQLDPTKDKTVCGTIYPVFAFIYIGAKGLLDEVQRFEVFGTIAHELCHFVMDRHLPKQLKALLLPRRSESV
jgi:Zn-dependent peptidase ImmA (M78 family)